MNQSAFFSAAGDAPPIFDQLATPSAPTIRRAVASVMSTELRVFLLKSLPQGSDRRRRPTVRRRSSPKPGGWAIARPPMSADGDGKNPSCRDSIVAGRPMESEIARATMPRASSVRAPIHSTTKTASATSAMAAGMRR